MKRGNVSRILSVLVLLSGIACGGGGGEGAPSPSQDQGRDFGAESADPGFLEAGGEEAPAEASELEEAGEFPTDGDEAADLAEGGEEVGPDCSVQPKPAGCPCVKNDECGSAHCLPIKEGSACAAVCSTSDDCPAGQACLPISGSTGALLCVDPTTLLCRPCVTDDDCALDPVPAEALACLAYGPEGSFCAYFCDDAGDCPEGYDCVETPEDRARKACRIQEGETCPCLDEWVNAGLETECFVENEAGKCTAMRGCDEACPAPTPIPEECNGKDDNCDGSIDELWPEKGKPCDGSDADFCPQGIATCKSTGDGTECKNEPVPPSPPTTELCDHIDNDCSGVTDDQWVCAGKGPDEPCKGRKCDVVINPMQPENTCKTGWWTCNKTKLGLECVNETECAYMAQCKSSGVDTLPDECHCGTHNKCTTEVATQCVADQCKCGAGPACTPPQKCVAGTCKNP